MTPKSAIHQQIVQKKATGFTLIEILVVVAVFSVTILIATSVFLLATSAQRRTTLAQKLQGDIRYALETIARDVRYGTIDYDCYKSSTGDTTTKLKCDPNDQANGDASIIDLHPTFGQTKILALQDSVGNRTRYGILADGTGVLKLQICISRFDEDPNTCASLAKWQVITPEGVKLYTSTIGSFSGGTAFYLYPFDSPYATSGAAAPDSPYTADAQPRVTVVLNTQSVVLDPSQGLVPDAIASQTTVTSRLYAR